MRKYETIFILNPSFDEETVKANIEKFKGVIENGGGTVDNVDFWGKRKLAYEIKKVGEENLLLKGKIRKLKGPEGESIIIKEKNKDKTKEIEDFDDIGEHQNNYE